MTSPIYAEAIAQELLLEHPDLEPSEVWINIRRMREQLPEPDQWLLSPTGIESTQIIPKWRH